MVVADSPVDLGALVEDFTGREERRLRAMVDEGASWLARLKQRRKIGRALRALEWADTRLMGETSFMWRHGLKVGFGIFVMTEVGFWRFLSMPGHPGDIVAGVIIGLVVGGFGGLMAAAAEWGQRETKFAETVAELTPTEQA